MQNTRPCYLVTGAAGFIGSRFVSSCNKRGIRVISVDKPEHFNARTEHQGVDAGTIIDREELFTVLKRDKPSVDAIVHMGACSDTMQLDEAFLRRVNIEYSQNIWNHARDHSIPLVYASSAATYGDGSRGYNDDEDLTQKLQPLNPYGESKRRFDLWALSEDRAGQMPPSWCGLRFFNVYGFGERHKARMASVVLHAFDQIRKTGRSRLFKSHREGIAHGHQKRDFIFVDDAVEVMHFAIEKRLKRGIYNLGTGEARTFLDLSRAVFAAMEKPEDIEFFDTPAELRDRYQYFTEAEMKKLRGIGYAKPFTSLETGVKSYVDELLKTPR
ncbi:MAG: ADP-glyceromanno-heptose 6-epimerase [Bdellovibrionales bacterium RIFOXYD1_FULL_53_11]|nr:MAG: ADP-glyceromanno-heptose 6-epimerase [Bdellovibrionales bacterium RIFOXYD1_FULL_53_11]